MADNADQRVPIQCANCGSIVPARIKPDGTLNPIGAINGCNCGESDFQIIEKDDPADESPE